MMGFSSQGRIVACTLVAVFLFAPSSWGQGKDKLDPAATRDYAVALGLQDKELYQLAVRRWQKFIKVYPKDPRRPNAFNHHQGPGGSNAVHHHRIGAHCASIPGCPHFQQELLDRLLSRRGRHRRR